MTGPVVSAIDEPVVGPDRDAHQLAIEQAVGTLYQNARARVAELAHRFDPELQPAGYGILRYLMAHEPIRAGDIVAALGTDKSAVSRQVTILRGMGLIDLRDDPDDRRATLLVLSERARSVRVEFRQEMRETYAQMLADWTDDEVSTFARLLDKFIESAV